MRVRNTFTDAEGTAVCDVSAYRPHSVATAVSFTPDVARVRVALPAPEGTRAHMSAQARVYRAMADAGVSLDMFTPVGETLVFSVSEDALARAGEVLADVGLTHQVRAGLAVIESSFANERRERSTRTSPGPAGPIVLPTGSESRNRGPARGGRRRRIRPR